VRLARQRRPTGGETSSRVLIIVQNLPVPFDRRVWLECQALRRAGFDVTVVCPKGPGDPSHQIIEGVELFKYRPYAPGGSGLGYVMEYVYSFAATAAMTFRARRRGAFGVLQACNPPDIFWPLARALRRADGTHFVFDHHDLCPELFQSRFDGGNEALLRGLRGLEGATVRTADFVTSTNGSYADIVIRRHGKDPTQVVVVRTGPDPERLRAGAPDPELRKGREHLVAYIGVMGPQDGVDIVLRAAEVVVHQMGREDVQFLVMGSGDCRPELLALREELNLVDYVDMPGRVPDEFVKATLSTADVGLSPDPKNPLNDVSTMNKTMEYMAFGLPVVAFDLKETRVSAQEAAVYVHPNSVDEYAKALVELLDDPERRERMGVFGRARVENELAWSHQERAYVNVFTTLTGRGEVVPAPAPVAVEA
jgi:glycosyltransferase involved in cell wall biosynthesis